MPRKKVEQPQLDVSGVSIKDLDTLTFDDISRLSTDNLKILASRMVSATNKRIRRLEKANLAKYSSAYKNIKAKGKRFSVKGKKRGRLVNMIKEMRNFLKAQSGSVQGQKALNKKVNKMIGAKKPLSSGKLKSFWKNYRKFEESNFALLQSYGDSDSVIREIQKYRDEGYSWRESLTRVKEKLEKAYEERELEESEYENEGDFLPI